MRAPINGQAEVTVRISGQLVDIADAVYGYTILPDDNRLQTSERFYKIVFNRPVRWYIPLIEVGYITVQGFCLHCSAQGGCNDFIGSSTGGFKRIVNTDKLVQSVFKRILTSRCSFYPQSVCKIKDFIGGKFGVVVTEEDISTQILNSLQNLKNVQSAQKTIQSMSPFEMLKDITGITTTIPDPTSADVQLVVTSYGNNNGPIPIHFSLATSRQLVG